MGVQVCVYLMPWDTLWRVTCNLRHLSGLLAMWKGGEAIGTWKMEVFACSWKEWAVV